MEVAATFTTQKWGLRQPFFCCLVKGTRLVGCVPAQPAISDTVFEWQTGIMPCNGILHAKKRLALPGAYAIGPAPCRKASAACRHGACQKNMPARHVF